MLQVLHAYRCYKYTIITHLSGVGVICWQYISFVVTLGVLESATRKTYKGHVMCFVFAVAIKYKRV